MNVDHEEVFEAEIAPLLAVIMKTCKEHGITGLMSFELARKKEGFKVSTTAHLSVDSPVEFFKALEAIMGEEEVQKAIEQQDRQKAA